MASTPPPTPTEVLSWIAADSPWFPARYAQSHGVPRELFDGTVGDLMQARLIEARDWVKDVGQGFALTAEGARAAKDPTLLAKMLAGENPDTPALTPPLGPTTFDRGERARDAYYYPRRPIVTSILLLLNLAVFVAGLIIAWHVGSGRRAFLLGQDMSTLQKLGAVSGDALVRGEWWRLLTTNFVHIGIIHLIVNLYTLGMIGALAENLWGRWRFTLIYLVSGLAGSSLAMGHHPNSLVAGASGAIWGLMTSLAVWLFQYRQHFDANIAQEFGRRLAVAIILNGAVSFVPHVSWQGHLGGALGGVAMAIALDWIRPGYRRRTWAGVIAALLIPVAIVAALLAVALRSDEWRPLIAREAAWEQWQFLQQFEPELDDNHQSAEALFAAMRRAGDNVLRYSKLEAQAAVLQSETTALRDRINKHERPHRLIEDLPAKTDAYCEAMDEFAQRSLDFLRGNAPDASAYQQARKLFEERWVALYQNRWMK